jgi:hypothetical protein
MREDLLEEYVSHISDGYSNWWHQVDQKNTGIQQGQLSNVNIKGNDNRVTVNQGQSVQGGSDTSGGAGGVGGSGGSANGGPHVGCILRPPCPI